MKISKITLLLLCFLFFILGRWSIANPTGYWKTNLSPPSPAAPATNFTGQELFDAVNRHRSSLRLRELTLENHFCNNIAQRWIDLTNNEKEAHPGYREWVNKYLPPRTSAGEIYAFGKTPEELVRFWVGSPSHRLILDDKTMVYGCAFAENGHGVVEMGRY